MVGNTNKRNETTGAQNSAKDNKPNKTVGNANKKRNDGSLIQDGGRCNEPMDDANT